jgi:hypothetical protein
MLTIEKKIIYVLLTGYILAFYSEWSFWSGRPAAEYFWLEAILTWLVYSCFAYFFLAAIVYFRAKSLWAIFLAGAIYGWLGEGLFVQTMYDSFPLNISWTALAWHSLISVLFGFYYLPKKLKEGRAWIPSLLAALALGFWSIGWWQEPDVMESIARIGDALLMNVFVYNAFFGLLLIPAYWLWLRFDIADFQPSRFDFAAMLTLALLYYAFVTIPTQPLALVVLPLCLAIVLFALWHNRQAETPPQKSSPSTIPFYHLLPLLLIPIVSSLFYLGALSVSLSLPTLPIVYVITLPLGFIMLGLAVWKLTFRRKLNSNLG